MKPVEESNSGRKLFRRQGGEWIKHNIGFTPELYREMAAGSKNTDFKSLQV
jgi:hypothetical protein